VSSLKGHICAASYAVFQNDFVTEFSTIVPTGNSTAKEEDVKPDALTTLTVVLVGEHLVR